MFTNPARCCGDCSSAICARHEAARDRAFQAHSLNSPASTASPSSTQSRPEMRNIPTINAIEYNSSLPEKIYVVQLPVSEQIRSGQIVQVLLDGAVHHIILPSMYVSPGDVMYVRANLPEALPHTDAESFRANIVTEVVVFDVTKSDLNSAQHLHPDASHTQHTESAAEVPFDAFLECRRCTYHNFLHAEHCAACEAPLLE